VQDRGGGPGIAAGNLHTCADGIGSRLVLGVRRTVSDASMLLAVCLRYPKSPLCLIVLRVHSKLGISNESAVRPLALTSCELNRFLLLPSLHPRPPRTLSHCHASRCCCRYDGLGSRRIHRALRVSLCRPRLRNSPL
jgi:hypothetical protein